MTEYDQAAVGMGSPEEFAASLLEAGAQYGSFNSLEQFVRPIQIEKGHGPKATMPGFRSPAQSNTSEKGNFGNSYQQFDKSFVGPTVHELDPYFPQILLLENGNKDDGSLFFAKNDFISVYSDATDYAGRAQTSLAAFEQVDGGDKADITKIRTNGALRGPLMLSGWGFGMDDRPIPSAGDTFPANTNFHNETPTKPDLWKTGPVHLAWDDERQVWAGGPRVVCGVVTTAIPKGKICGGSKFKMRLLRNNSPNPQKVNNFTDQLDEIIEVSNRDVSLEEDQVANQIFCIAIKINYEWLPIWVGCPDEPACGEDEQPPPPPCLAFSDCP